MKYGHPIPSYEQLRRNFHGRIDESLRGLARAGTSDAELVAMLQDFLEIDNNYIENVNDHLFADAIELARRASAKNIQQILVTNRAHGIDRGNASPRMMVINSVLRDHIFTVICGDEVDIRKPDPKVLGVLRHQIDPKRTVMVGDQSVDALFAHNVGARAVLVNRFEDEIRHMEKFYASGGNDAAIYVKSSLHDIEFT